MAAGPTGQLGGWVTLNFQRRAIQAEEELQQESLQITEMRNACDRMKAELDRRRYEK